MRVNVRTVNYLDGKVNMDTTQRIQAPSQWDALIAAGYRPDEVATGADLGERERLLGLHRSQGDLLVTGRNPITGCIEWEVSATEVVPPVQEYEAGDLVVTRIAGREEVLRVHQRLDVVKDGRPGFIGAPVGATLPDCAWAYDSQITEVYRQVTP